MQAPTDNLYKFMAIAGLACLLFVVFDYNKRTDAINDALNELTVTLAVLNAQLDIDDRNGRRWEQKIDLHENETIESKYGKETLNEWLAYRQKSDESKLSAVKQRELANVVAGTYAKLRVLAVAYWFFGVGSLILFLLGVTLWYVKTQRYLDLKEASITIQPRIGKMKDTLPRRRTRGD